MLLDHEKTFTLDKFRANIKQVEAEGPETGSFAYVYIGQQFVDFERDFKKVSDEIVADRRRFIVGELPDDVKVKYLDVALKNGWDCFKTTGSSVSFMMFNSGVFLCEGLSLFETSFENRESPVRSMLTRIWGSLQGSAEHYHGIGSLEPVTPEKLGDILAEGLGWQKARPSKKLSKFLKNVQIEKASYGRVILREGGVVINPDIKLRKGSARGAEKASYIFKKMLEE